MRIVPRGIDYVFPPITTSDGRTSLCTLPPGFVQRAISNEDFAALSDEFDIEEATVRAVMAVESNGSGFLLHEPAPSRPKILFEAHVFFRKTPQPVSATRPDLSSPQWDKSLYKGGSAEWDRLLDAMAFDEEMALQSASFGLGQVMGFNFGAAGCNSVTQLVTEAFAGEYWQARHMMNFIVHHNLRRALRNRDWASFAFGYNGAGFRQNQYDTKLAQAHTEALRTIATLPPTVATVAPPAAAHDFGAAAVRAYLETLVVPVQDTPTPTDALERLGYMQQQAAAVPLTVPDQSMTESFVAAAPRYATQHGISYTAWRNVGVPAQVLDRCGIKSST